MFAWNFKKSEDAIVKYWACLNAARFLACMDAIVPALPEKLKSERFQKVMRLTKKITNEESGNIPHLVHVWQVISRHWQVIYPYRHNFITLMLQSVSRLGLHAAGSSAPVEFRHVAFNIAQTIVLWELHRKRNLLMKQNSVSQNADLNVSSCSSSSNSSSPGTKPRADSSMSVSSPAGHQSDTVSKVSERRRKDELKSRTVLSKADDFTLNASFLQVLVSFLVRMAVSVADNEDTSVSIYASKCVVLYKQCCDLFNIVNVHIAHYERLVGGALEEYTKKALQTQSQTGYTPSNNKLTPVVTLPELYLKTNFEILNASLQNGMSALVSKNIPSIVKLVKPIFLSRNATIYSLFRQFVKRITELAPVDLPPVEWIYFYRKLKDETEMALDNRNLYLDQTPQLSPAVMFALQLIEEVTVSSPCWVNNHGTTLIRMTQRLLAEQITRSAKLIRAEQGTGDSDAELLVLNLQPTSSASVFLEG
eukprot:GSChrysophyteH1.ASY1.ANO1.1968.1 assembled CDS